MKTKKPIVDWFGNEMLPTTKNPMVLKCGVTKDRWCRDCEFFLKTEYHGKVYYKCKLRGVSNCESTDHRKKWEACAKFVQKNYMGGSK